MQYRLNKIYSEFVNVHQVCQEALAVSNANDIEAILIGGSLLGMVRDNDFLPWDKDVDFCVYQNQAEAVYGLESQFRQAGFECRKHSVGVRTDNAIENGIKLLSDITSNLAVQDIQVVVTTGALLSLYRDKTLKREVDTLAMLMPPVDVLSIKYISEALKQFENVMFNYHQNELKSITLEHKEWRVNLFVFHFYDGQGVWRDLNCEHYVDADLLDYVETIINGKTFNFPKQTETFLACRFGDEWQKSSPKKFSQGRAKAFFQAFKDGVMVDFIIHYQIDDKTYWFEPNANVISTKGFTPTEQKQTTAGELCFPQYPEVFLEEHYGDWKTPVKSWNGAVDNPTLVDNDNTLQKILSQCGIDE